MHLVICQNQKESNVVVLNVFCSASVTNFIKSDKKVVEGVVENRFFDATRKKKENLQVFIKSEKLI